MQKLSKLLLFFALFSSSFLYSEAIVNIEDLRRDGEQGFFANISASLSSFKDYKATLIGQFDFHINESFKISLQYNTFYDSKPPSEAVKKEEGFATVFSYNFN